MTKYFCLFYNYKILANNKETIQTLIKGFKEVTTLDLLNPLGSEIMETIGRI